MKIKLYVIADSSGSMVEIGKVQIQKNILRFISELSVVDKGKYSEIDFCYFHWNSSVTELAVQCDGDIQTLYPRGCSELSALSDVIEVLVNDGHKNYMLLLTDGNFSSRSIHEFLKRIDSRLNGNIRFVAIGADADMRKLEKLSTNGCVFLAENISAAIDSILYGSEREVSYAPLSVGQINLPQPITKQGDWDE